MPRPTIFTSCTHEQKAQWPCIIHWWALSIGVATVVNEKALFMTLVDRISRFHAHWSHFFGRVFESNSHLLSVVGQYIDGCIIWTNLSDPQPILEPREQKSLSWTDQIELPSDHLARHTCIIICSHITLCTNALAHRVMAIESNDKEQTSPLASLEIRWPVKTRGACAARSSTRMTPRSGNFVHTAQYSDQSWVLYRRAHYQNLYLIVTYKLLINTKLYGAGRVFANITRFHWKHKARREMLPRQSDC